MPEDIDNSLLERLQALRGSSSGASPGRAAPINVDVIERSKPATREDTLAARLKSLRDRDYGSPKTEKVIPASSPASSGSHPAKAQDAASTEKSTGLGDGDDVDLMFSTDDQTLEELLGDVSPDENPVQEPSDEQVKALLEELSLSVPKDNADEDENENKAGDSDDSDGEQMQKKVNDILAQFKDEAELEAALGNPDDEADSAKQDQDEDQDGDADLALPSLPSNLDDLSTFSSHRSGTTADMDDITARMAALKAPAAEDAFSLPSVPSSKPSAGDKPIKRLTSKTDYTDDDIDSWCTVCLNDATLRCLGCDDDPYCTRCWREMHIGPAAAFDDRSHKAVQFTRAKKKDKQRVALGA
ncbi:uncharacterized protein TRIVIDRAFT_31972 [Trichoderma virens Gv29-8]|uniref:Abscission/NoCut checkpoint regulator n=1 Tax=Hypocrea virens (strain Gv29-8 / FGSC 10586) TaxID=413071 RepID=G9MIW1_HYPVG|nr:uncharacterized protein TRIVIDRAFT_31972 [Trichoderma virens Gv29-8]EHK25427.1 hypothetical protein TRIVIDRAFT_31972 [Trichoderma virens Gv29-8]UKZ48753.1 hypothetical protein TrVGV298_002982 [Trichoderma virens]